MNNSINPKEVVGYILFKRVQIINANSISSPITYGFPAITGFLGAFHALSRKMSTNEAVNPYSLGGVLLACHDCQPQVYRSSKYSNYTFNQTRNPIKKDGKTASIIEEGKCHLTMSFVVEVLGDEAPSSEEIEILIQLCKHLIQQQRIAGGSVHGLDSSLPVSFIEEEEIDTLAPLLMPAFVLMDAQDTFAEIIEEQQSENPEKTALDALLDVCTLHHITEPRFKNGEPTGEYTWTTTSVKSGRSSGSGWLVPIPIGYQGISDVFEPELMQHARNPEYPSQYVEAIYSLGRWIYPQRLTDEFENAFWRYSHDAKRSLYLVTQDNP
ncbi:type I-F CRISPR-associated protein Csy2 [Suttonella sp. R2A3]|uniref:type I-F CRISPR-associated protein Csy2 n=1 Tax=Suttonella sp. R2A3 TaxID=2908648 RepID=UPI001F225AFC|nr:type I-F CRISPR-associated protein Csy2 [Suttonella sp. R2A3]UJF25017.1 type I-F CRISPR-associated protein Csy2 [Suttonella sp. R2A3]